MTIDISKIRVGDDVTVRAIVTEVGSRGTAIRVQPPSFTSSGDQWISIDDVTSHTPQPLSFGDTVRGPFISATGVIRAIQGGFAWVDCGTDDDPLMQTVELGKLERVYD